MNREIELLVLNGSELLTAYEKYTLGENNSIVLTSDMISATSQYRETALLYQIRQVLQLELARDAYLDKLFFVDFNDFFTKEGNNESRLASFEKLLTNGVLLHLDKYSEANLYVPFEKSQSQAKECVISFIRADLFAPVRRRLDLDIDFGDQQLAQADTVEFRTKTPAQLSKLYAYRGLYLSDATRIEGFRELLDAQRIIVLPDETISNSTDTFHPKVFTAKVHNATDPNDDAILKEMWGNDQQSPSIKTVYDGVGLISPRAAAMINKGLYGDAFEMPQGDDTQILQAMRQNRENVDFSFQFRLPFCKGMLHTVDFHRFLEDVGVGSYMIKDAFGIQRDLRKAEIILNKSVFKLYSLLGYNGTDWDNLPDPMQYYFSKIDTYGHSLYIAKTDRNFRSKGFTQLNSQLLNTLDLPQDVFEKLVQQHLQQAAQCRTSEVIVHQGDLDFIRNNPRESWVKYIKADYRLAVDSYVESLIDATRRAKLDDVLKGHLDVEGDMLFLSRDLLHYLCCIAERTGANVDEVKTHCLSRGAVYIPGKKMRRECAVFRNPHLSSNENVLAMAVPGNAWRKRYLGHLNRVAMVAANSFMPSALGGADFDGDMVNIVYDADVLNACRGNSYSERLDLANDSLPFILIPSLSASPSAQDRSTSSPYVDVKTICSTFSNRVGSISNMALKIRAAEAVWQEPTPIPFTSALCTILTGVEIDAAKTGRRPDLRQVHSFILNPPAGAVTESIKAISTYIDVCNKLKKVDQKQLKFTADGDDICISTEFSTFTTIKKKDGAPQLYQLLYLWAKVRAEQSEDLRRQQAAAMLCQMIPGKKKSKNIPAQDVLVKLVFQNQDALLSNTDDDFAAPILAALNKATSAYNHNQVHPLTIERKDCIARAIMVLKLQYDDIDDLTDTPTLRTRSQRVLEQLTDHFSAQENQAQLHKSLFSGTSPKNYWLYQAEDGRQAILQTLGISQIPDVHLLTNFRDKGYMLLHYALCAGHRKGEVDRRIRNMAQKTDDDRESLYRLIFSEAMQKHLSRSASKALVYAQCRMDLLAAAEKRGITDPSELFKRIYPIHNKNDVLWHIFTWDEIKACIGGAELA